jgi:hypothetical protein
MASKKEKLEKKLLDKKNQEEVAINYLKCIQADKRKIEQEIKKLEPVRITEHAILRYFERFYNVPVDDLKKELFEKLSDLPRHVIESPEISYIHKGMNLRMVNGTVITIVKPQLV